MKIIIQFLLVILTLVITSSALFTQVVPPDSLYLGQTPPGNIRKVFNLTVDQGYFAAEKIAISPDGKELYYEEVNSSWTSFKFKYYKYYNSKWNGPLTLFNGFYCLSLSPDGSSIYFENNNYNDSWISSKQDTLWSTPVRVLKNFNVHSLNVTSLGNYYLSSIPTGGLGQRDICQLIVENSDTSLVGLGLPLNSSSNEGDFFISNDESFIIVMSNRSGGFGRTDLFLSYRKSNDTWTNPKNMGTSVNTPGDDFGPYVTTDNKYLFYESGYSSPSSIYWIKVDELIDSLRYTNFVPYLNYQIPTQSIQTCESFNYTIPDTTFIDDDGNNTLTYSATLSNGNPLPSWLSFDSLTQTFTGTPPVPGNISIKVKAVDSANASVSCTFPIDVNIGIFKAYITGKMYNDKNKDGIDDGETGLAGWTIGLYGDTTSYSGDLITTTVTDASGNYSFTVCPGKYYVKEVVRNNWVKTEPVGTYYTVVVSDTVTYAANNFGNWEYGTLHIELSKDVNGNGLKDPDTMPLPNGAIANITILKNDVLFMGQPLGNGTLAVDIDSIENATYKIVQSLIPDGWLRTTTYDTITYVYNAGSQKNNVFFLNFKKINVSGVIYNDLDGDGIKDAGEPGLDNWTATLSKTGSNVTDLTNANGEYRFENVVPGTWTLSETVQSGWVRTSAVITAFNATSGMDKENMNIGNSSIGSITGIVYRDFDGGANTTSDQVAVEWGLSIYKDTISEGTLVSSTATGAIAINNIQVGTYFVVEENKGSAWKRINGNLGLIDTVIVSVGDDAVVTFVNFKPNSLTIRKVKDNDGKLSTNNDRVVAPWHLELHRGTISGTLVYSSDDGLLNVSNLGDDTYVLVESDSASWINLGYSLNGTDHASTDKNYTFVLSDGMNTTFDFINVPPIYNKMYRSFDPDGIAGSKDLKSKYKYIARKANADEFEFELTAPQSVTLLLKFSMASSGVVMNGTEEVGAWTNAKTITTTAIDSGDVVHVFGWGYKGSLVKTGYEWATLPKKTTGNVGAYLINQPRLPMPNRLNALYDAFALSGFPAGLQVGMDKSVPDSTKLYGWLNSPKASDVAKTLNNKGTHTALAHSFDTWLSGKPFLKRQKSISSAKYNNILLAQMISLKLNIAASSMEMIPIGFGELIFDDASLVPPTGAPALNGLMVKEVASLVDSMMMGWAHVDTIIKGKPVYSRHFHDPAVMAYLNTIVTKINNSFEGQLDTTSFASSLVFTGVKKLIDVPYLRASGVMPAKIVPDYTKLEQIPESYKLYQNYPNPFNPTTTIQFDIPQEAMVTLKIYNLLGQEVATVLDGELFESGLQTVEYDANMLASGVYFYQISARGIEDTGAFSKVMKMILIK